MVAFGLSPARHLGTGIVEPANLFALLTRSRPEGTPMPDQDVEQPVVAEALVRRFGDIEAVAGIDLELAAGEVFGFLGPNGAGKSTTVRMLTTLLRPTSGRARVAGHDVVNEADAVRRSIGVALQDAAIDPLMTGRELLRLQAILHGIDKAQGRERSDILLRTVGLTAAADRRVGTYSGGMRRRLDLALALVHEPQVLFLDEPTTGLDPNSRVTLWDEVRKLNRESGTTVFLTTQYMEEADQLAGRIAIIDDGHIVAEGTPARLKAEVGEPTLRVAVAPGEDKVSVEALLIKFGEPVPDATDYIAIRLAGGAARVGAVSRALDEAGVHIEGLELHTPTLDDVFHRATGRRLEGAEGHEAKPADEFETTR
jgi:ABC-2 type transport system ATP-binding protein